MLLITDEELDLVCKVLIEEHEGLDLRDLQEIEKHSIEHMRKGLGVNFSEVVRSGWTKEEVKRFSRR